MGHPDFRVNGKIFATLGYPDSEHGVVILPPEEQAKLIVAEPQTFTPARGAWGATGATQVRLALAESDTLQSALALAWRKRTSKRTRLRRTNES